MCKYQRFGVQKLPKHRYLQCFVPSTFAWNCRNIVNTSIFCDQPAKTVVIYNVFMLGFQKHCYLQCFVDLGSKKYWALQHFLRFCMAPGNDVKTQKCCNLYSILWIPKNEKSSEKCVKTALFSGFRTPQNASSNFTFFLSTPDPEKRENPSRLKDFRGGSAAGARPRVAKAMLSFHHYTASPEFKRLRATAGQGPNYVGPAFGCMLAYVGLMLTHVGRKDPKNGNSKTTL